MPVIAAVASTLVCQRP